MAYYTILSLLIIYAREYHHGSPQNANAIDDQSVMILEDAIDAMKGRFEVSYS